MKLKSLGLWSVLALFVVTTACEKSSPARPSEVESPASTASVTDANTGVTVTTPQPLTPTTNQQFKYSEQPLTLTVKNAISIDSTAADVTIHGATQIKLFSGKSSITLFSSGDIEISGENINIAGKVTSKMGTGSQTFSSDTSAAAVSGSNVSVGGDGTGKVEVKGGVIKLN